MPATDFTWKPNNHSNFLYATFSKSYGHNPKKLRITMLMKTTFVPLNQGIIITCPATADLKKMQAQFLIKKTKASWMFCISPWTKAVSILLCSLVKLRIDLYSTTCWEIFLVYLACSFHSIHLFCLQAKPALKKIFAMFCWWRIPIV